MPKIKRKQKLSILMMPVMVLYLMLPCISQAAPIQYKSVQSAKFICHDAYHGVDSIQPTGTITYFYNGSTLMNAEDDNGDMSTYLDRTVRTIVNVNTQTVLDTQCLFTDGKNVISQTDNAGTSVTSTQQYNPFGQPVNYNSNTNSQLSIATNPFAYDGYYYDQESGLYYLNARYYSPTLMQFISMDTYDLANRYAYCDGNPIGNEDPTGHLPLFLMFSKFAEKVLTQYLNPIQMSGNAIGTSPLDIIEDVANSIVQTTDILDCELSEELQPELKKSENILSKIIDPQSIKEKNNLKCLDKTVIEKDKKYVIINHTKGSDILGGHSYLYGTDSSDTSNIFHLGPPMDSSKILAQLKPYGEHLSYRIVATKMEINNFFSIQKINHLKDNSKIFELNDPDNVKFNDAILKEAENAKNYNYGEYNCHSFVNNVLNRLITD